MMDDQTLQAIVDLAESRRWDGSTHWDGCVGDHVDCALTALLDEVYRLEVLAARKADSAAIYKAELDRLRDGITRHRVGRYAEMFSDPEEAIEDDIHTADDDLDLALWELIGDDDA